jgi:hypothetical protein
LIPAISALKRGEVDISPTDAARQRGAEQETKDH